MDNATPRRHELLNEDLSVRHKILPKSLGVTSSTQNNRGYCHCSCLPTTTTIKTLLLKIPLTLHRQHRDTNLELSRKLPCYLAYIVPAGIKKAADGESTSTVLPSTLLLTWWLYEPWYNSGMVTMEISNCF